MQSSLIWLKVKERLNKLDSSDYDNIECWQVREAYNKAQLEWVRRQIHGNNQKQEGDEETRIRIDDLQNLLKPSFLSGTTKESLFFETAPLPKDYLYFKRVTPLASKNGCTGKRINSKLREEANVDELLDDWSSQPSFDFEQTFHTIIGNKIRVYTNDDFEVEKVKLTYYRKPREIDFGNCEHLDGSAGQDIDPEFKDDIVELIIDDTISILAGDIESPNQYQLTKQRTEVNN